MVLYLLRLETSVLTFINIIITHIADVENSNFSLTCGAHVSRKMREEGRRVVPKLKINISKLDYPFYPIHELIIPHSYMTLIEMTNNNK